MATETTMETFLAKLEDSNSDLRHKVGAAQELRDNVDSWSQGAEYSAFLKQAVPVFLKVLDGPPVFINVSPEQKIRICILEIFQRLPGTQVDAVEPHAVAIVDKLMDIVREENEDNGIVIVKTISDFLRHYNKTLEDKVQPFLSLIQEMFQTMDQTVKDTFDSPGNNAHPATPHNPQFSQSPRPGSPVSTSSSELGGEQQQSRQLQKGMHSFKVLCECPIIVVSIFQAYKKMTADNVKEFIPLIKNVLLLQAKPQEKAHADAKARGEIFTGVSPQIKNRAAFGDLITMQVKTMSFLAYLLRLYAQQLSDFLYTLPHIVIRMLKDCPRERSGARKELLVAIRHIINFNFRKIFLAKIDELLDERVLIGDGLTVYETMRPLAYSMLADLIHHLRDSLNKEQIRRAIEVYTKNLHDDFPGTSFQTMSAKLLLNMAECIAKNQTAEDARYFLVMILNAIGDKFAAMNRQYDNAVKISAQHTPPSIETTAENYLADKDAPPDWDEIDIFSASPIKTSSPRDRTSDPIQENRFLFRNLVTGLKNLFHQLRSTNPPRPEGEESQFPSNWHEVSYAFDAEQLNVLIKLLREGCKVFRYYGTDKQNSDSQKLTTSELLATQNMMAGGKDEKELLEAFATVFHLIDPAIFHELFTSEIPHLYEMCFEHAPLLHIAQFLLASEATSPNFCGLLLQFLMDKIEDVGTSDTQKATLLLRLFKLSFMAVTLFAPQNEQVLQPHVVKIVTKAIELSTTADEPTNYFLLLRSLFRSIGGGRFEHLYKELLPLLEMLLDVLNNLLKSARKPGDRDLFVELILTVPARLSNLLPHLSYLMRPLVVALRAGSELVGQGLRTLELCVDNLTADYIDPIMAPVIDELMKGLWEHLKPAPYNHFHAHTTMRILGKLGGRNRKFLDGLPPLEYKPYTDDVSSFDIKLIGTTKDRAFPSSIGIDMAINKLMETPRGTGAKASDAYYKNLSLKFITAQIKLLIGLEQLPDDFAQLVRLQAQDFVASTIHSSEDLYTISERTKSAVKCDAQQEELQKLLKAVHFAQSIPDLKEEAAALTNSLCRHFMLLELGRTVAQYKHRPKPFDPRSGEGPLFIDSKLIADVIADCLSSDVAAEREAAEQSLLTCREALVTIFGSRDGADKLPFLTTLSRVFTHHCHQEEWFLKAGGTLGLDIMVHKLNIGDGWLLNRNVDIVRALLYVIKDMPADVTAKVRLHAAKLLQTVVRRVTQAEFKAADIKTPDSKLNQLCKILVLELMHISVHVRSVTQSLFSIIAEELGVDVAELINPIKDVMLVFIFNKPLRALPFPAQIAYIDAITYCLSLNPQAPPAQTPAPGEEDAKPTPAPQPHNSIIPFNDQLTRLLMECLALADTDDDSLSSKPTEFRNADNIVKLRAGCIRLLTVAQNQPEFMGSTPRNSAEPSSTGAAASPQQRTPGSSSFPSAQSRARIITVFFKSLYFKNPEVIAAANAGLKSVLGVTSKLPKDLLQSGLKPVLMNLQDPRKLSVEGLEGLARLLKLLPNYFKVEVGARLLDHLKILAEPAVLQKVSFTLLEQNKPMRIIAAIIDIVHLLPSAAVEFLPNVVGKVLEMESQLRRTRGSLFRSPLVRFLNLYPQAACKLFTEKLKDLTYGRFWSQILADATAEPLRAALYEDVASLLAALALSASEEGANAQELAAKQKEKHIAQINAIHAVAALRLFPDTKDVLVKNDQLRKALFDAGKDLEKQVRSNKIDSTLRLAAEQAGEQLLSLIVTYLELETEERTNFEVFVQLVDAVTTGKLKPSFELPRYIYRNIIDIEDNDRWRKTVLRCIEFYANKNTSQRAKTYLFHRIVNPILAMDVKRNWASLTAPQPQGTKLVDKLLLTTIETKLWKPIADNSADDQSSQGVDHSRMELLQLTAMLLKYHTTFVSDTRKTLIRFAWTSTKNLEDVVNKHAAYVVVAYFINLFDTPPKLTVVTYNDLLRAHQNECKSLVTQGLELLAPVLKKRLSPLEHRLPMWANRPRRILLEDSHNLQQMMSVFNFLVRHDDIFFEVREILVPSIIPSLTRIAAPMAQGSSPSNEHKKAALNVVNLIWKWEQRAHKESLGLSPSASPASLKRKADGSPVVAKKPELATPQLRMVLIKYLVQFMAVLQEPYPVPQPKPKETHQVHSALNVQPASPSEVAKMAIRLLYNLLNPPYWTDLELDPLITKVLEPLLTKDAPEESEKAKHKEWFIRFLNSLQVLKVFVNVKPDDWILNRVTILQKLLDKALRLEDVVIQTALHGIDEELPMVKPLLARVLDAIPVSDATAASAGANEDETMEDTPATDFIAALNTIASDALSNGNLLSGINLLWTLSNSRPKEIDQQLPALMKIFPGKLAKDHLSPQVQQTFRPSDQQQQQQADNSEVEIQTGLLLKCISILAGRMEVLGEHRRPYLSALASIVERSHSREVCTKIMDLSERWVFNSENNIPTLKEKVAVLSKMLFFENRSDQTLLSRFLELVIKVYEDSRVTRTELTVRLENAFLIGSRAQDVDMRNRFMAIFDKHISRTPSARLDYLLCHQDWNTLGDSFWLSQVIQLLFGSLEMNQPIQLHPDDFKTMPAATWFNTYAKDSRIADVIVDDSLETMMNQYRRFCQQMADIKLKDVMEPLAQLQHVDRNLAKDIWVAIFPLFWSALPKEDRPDFEINISSLLTKDFHYRQLDQRPNCVQALLEGVVRAKPRMKVPPHVVKFLAKTYNVWYVAANYLEESAVSPVVDTPAVRESTSDALVDLYHGLEETDLFYGTWRRRCQYVETNAALSYEQIGMWDKAQQMYEGAQVKARTGALPYSQGEYLLWEDHWILCAQKLQQWEILMDFAKHENFNDLYLEATWRNFDAWTNTEMREQLDSIIKSVGDAPTPRRTFFQAFMSLLKLHNKSETPQDFNRTVDEAIQLSIKKWHQLPRRMTNAHIGLLQHFQQLVELHDAQIIFNSLGQTNQQNLDVKSQELKMLLGTWRDRLPNFWDDINAWQDLVTWRQHIFHMVNAVYLTLVPPSQGNANNQSFAYRGYHETAWIINRFAHVARQHNLQEVCIAQLSTIYTLPNIEIQEAFLKLREQAKCHYQNKTELAAGLDVINNTNLNYFAPPQKAEFYALKGMFLSKLGQKTEANDAFGMALYFDIKLPKAWAEWGRYNDQLFKEDPKNLEKASSAISCYLEAASQFKNAKSRKLLGRILWLLSLDDADHTLAKTFDAFKGDTPVWYWITFIPQLLLGLSRPEAPIMAQLLKKLAKQYPQALYFQLRTSREDLHLIRKQQETKEAKEKEMKEKRAKQLAAQQGTPKKEGEAASQATPKQSSSPSRPGTAGGQANGDATPSKTEGPATIPKSEPAAETAQTPNGNAPATAQPRKPWDYADDITQALKTAFPLLAWSMEAIVDTICKHFKCMPDEDAHRLIVALYNDGIAYVGRSPHLYAPENKLPAATEANITRFAESVCPKHVRESFMQDFVNNKPTMFDYIQRLRKWRNRFEERLDRRPNPVYLESLTLHLSEFRFTKFDEVEVPGQYLLYRDKNQNFIRIERFLPEVELVRGTNVSHRRLKIRGHDGSVHPFHIQHPAGRYGRREERISQLFRAFNATLQKRKEARRRNLSFNLPLIIPLSPNVRMIEDDPSYTNLQSIYEDYCRNTGVNKDDPILYTIEKLRAAQPVGSPTFFADLPSKQGRLTGAELQKTIENANNIKLEIFNSVQEKFCPNTVALNYFKDTFERFDDYWLFRKSFAYQFAAHAFMTYIFYMNGRVPHKFNISRKTGKVWGIEMYPSMASQRAVFHNPEHVPIRLTPNLQTLMGPLITEGIFAPSIMAIARCLTDPDGAAEGTTTELEMQLSVFVRDEVSFWFTQQHRPGAADGMLREMVQMNSDQVAKRAKTLANPPEGRPGNLPANQTVVDLVAASVRPGALANSDVLWMGYL